MDIIDRLYKEVHENRHDIDVIEVSNDLKKRLVRENSTEIQDVRCRFLLGHPARVNVMMEGEDFRILMRHPR